MSDPNDQVNTPIVEWRQSAAREDWDSLIDRTVRDIQQEIPVSYLEALEVCKARVTRRSGEWGLTVLEDMRRRRDSEK